MRVKLKEITDTLQRVRHRPIDEQGQWLGTVIGGYFAYFAVPTNTHMLSAFRAHISEQWFRSLRRRSQQHRLTWARMSRLIGRFLPPLRVRHPWPDRRFEVGAECLNWARSDLLGGRRAIDVPTAIKP
jgi:RNA-directed DNA polymerase